jgi:hypothetical protein
MDVLERDRETSLNCFKNYFVQTMIQHTKGDYHG